MNEFIAAGLTVLAGWFAWRAWRDNAQLTAARAQLLSGLGQVLDDVSETPLPSGYVKVTGTYRGQPAIIEPIVDTLNVRKLPVLWLMVTVPGPVPVRASFDLMMRATGMEVFSNYRDLNHTIDTPAGFPEWAGIRTDDPAGLPMPEIFAPYLARFHDGPGKELLVTPKGLRMVVMADQADRGGYLIFRDARFGVAQLAPDAVRGMLDDLHALRCDLEAQSENQAVAS
ncbi:MAG: hypothetical protein Q7T86_06855 [Hyphomicrobiaceae bacterium]|nr:hypothetical protein [Hyphomicrobiaceae bacterium]